MRIKILTLILFLGMIFSLYSCIGYFALALNSGVIIGKVKHYFMGNIILGITFLLISVILIILMILILRKFKAKVNN